MGITKFAHLSTHKETFARIGENEANKRFLLSYQFRKQVMACVEKNHKRFCL